MHQTWKKVNDSIQQRGKNKVNKRGSRKTCHKKITVWLWLPWGEVRVDLFYCQLVEDLRNLMKKKNKTALSLWKVYFSPLLFEFTNVLWNRLSVEIQQVESVYSVPNEVKDFLRTTISFRDRFHVFVQNIWQFLMIWSTQLFSCRFIVFARKKEENPQRRF